MQAIDTQGNKVWERTLDIYGKVRKETEENTNFVPFLFQGQYFDSETDLCYNRYRYYSPDTGTYISQDPISIAGGLNLYSYVHDSNFWLDIFGLYLRRPYIRKSTRLIVEKEATIINGRFYDTVDGIENKIEIAGGKRKSYSLAEGEYHLGHKENFEYRILKADAEAKGLTQKQFNDLMNNPDLYQIEDPKTNMSHKREAKTNKCK
ncbi:RHS repeat-associated core domain-containing protein [Treponema pedis]|uniref:RHS repeat-associated core domain-containing protein n=1 Tax=Treponema pedis TaxID=409322 RepID=UPI001C079312|nr:RHS repeat-associated core domain-containing protein [Treponema pedis]